MNSPWKKDFPALFNKPISYLDSAATCQVPEPVINAVEQVFRNGLGNAGRGLHSLSERATDIMSECRRAVATFIGSQSSQVIFTKSSTESINLVANSLRSQLTVNDSILITQMEHHSNYLPWVRLAEQTGARLNILPLSPNGELNDQKLQHYLQDNCQIFAFSHGSNILGTGANIQKYLQQAQKYQVKTLIDGAQTIAHKAVDVAQLACDYYIFSAHKLYAGGGCGVLYSRSSLSLEPLLLGGGAVVKVSKEQYYLHDNNAKFEAGSGNINALAGLLASINYLNAIGMEKISAYEKKLTTYLNKQINNKTPFKIISHPNSHSLVSFYNKTFHCHDVASLLAEQNIAIRAGHHCAQPCLKALGIKHCLRASVGLYTDFADIDRLVDGLNQAVLTLS